MKEFCVLRGMYLLKKIMIKLCLDFVELSGINNCCQNCLEVIYKKLSEVLIKIIK